MSTLREFLVQKREKVLAYREKLATDPASAPTQLAATVTAEGRSGVRRIKIREFQILSDSGPELAGYSFGPGSPEIQLGVLGSCLTHIYEIQAALAQVPLDSLSVDVTGQVDHRSGEPGFENVPRYPHNIEYTVRLESPATPEQLAELHARVEDVCPILNLLTHPQHISGTVVNNGAVVVNRSLVAA